MIVERVPVPVRLARRSARMPSGCLEWTGCKNNVGYGQIRVQGKALLTHRVAWTIANGEIPEGLCVLHKCDTPACIDPAHLFLGTKADNTRDMMQKGRNRHRWSK